MKMPKPLMVARVTTAEDALNESARCLASANEDRAAGNARSAARWDRLAQRWLDIRNDLAGEGEGKRRRASARVYTIADVPLPWSGKRYHENEDRVRLPHYPCCICGKEVTNADAVWLPIGDGNSRFIHPSEPQPGDVGGYPIGRSCLKKYPALRALGYIASRLTHE